MSCLHPSARLLFVTLLLTVPLLGCGGAADSEFLELSGHIEVSEVRIATKIPGRLLALYFEEGDEVQLGQKLAQIDSTDQRLGLNALRAERTMAQAELRLRIAGARSEEIATAQSGIDQAESEAAAATRDLERMQSLFAAGSISAKQRDDAKTRSELAQARLRAAKEQWLRLERGNRSEEIDAARARLAAAEARLDLARQQLLDTQITAPIAGRVTRKLADAGELLGAGAPIAILSDLRSPWLTVYLSEPDLSFVALGQEVEVKTDGGVVRSGRLSYIASEAEFTPRNVQTREERVKLVFEAKIQLSNPDGLWKTGMPAQARIPVRKDAS